jgi:hypothetical protein
MIHGGFFLLERVAFSGEKGIIERGTSARIPGRDTRGLERIQVFPEFWRPGGRCNFWWGVAYSYII